METNSTPSYSNDALSVKSIFYNKSITVYVEGGDDIPFWFEMLKLVSSDFHIEDAGGLPQLEKEQIPAIKNGCKNIIVACDRDYSMYYEDNPYNHPQIITTYGHSIENTMFCPKNIAINLQRLCLSEESYLPLVNDWYSNLTELALKLLPYDACNHIKEKGETCYGDNCCRFLINDNNCNLDAAKIQQHIVKLGPKFDELELTEISNKISLDTRSHRHKIKGHFISNALYNLLKTEAKRAKNTSISLSKASIYAAYANCIEKCTTLCEDRSFLLNQIRAAFDSASTLPN